MERMCTMSKTPGPDAATNFAFSLDGVDVLTVSVKPGGAGSPASIGVWQDDAEVSVRPDASDDRLLVGWSND